MGVHDKARRPKTTIAVLAAQLLWLAVDAPALGATFGPPMLDINKQCDANSRHNVRAMSECVVAESEARAEILQNWHKLSDASADKCVKLGRKSKKLPYSMMAKCLAVEQVDASAPSAKPASK